MKMTMVLICMMVSLAFAQERNGKNLGIPSFHSEGESGLWEGHGLLPRVPKEPDYVEKQEIPAREAQPIENLDFRKEPPSVVRRPGALTGKFVYVNAGHGFTNYSGVWKTQRGNLYEMVEDHANADQVNHWMIEYLRNAGATVIPMRDVGPTTEMHIIDNGDPGFSLFGTWYESAGPVFWGEAGDRVHYVYSNTGETQTGVARWTPDFKKAGRYPVFVWYSDGQNRCTQATYRIFHKGGMETIVLDQRRVGKGWIWMGNYYFDKGTLGYVELSNRSTDQGKVVIADAVRFGSGVHPTTGYPWQDMCAHEYTVFSKAPESITGASDVWCRPRMAAYMNNAEIERACYISFHTNASTGSSRGAMVLKNKSDNEGGPVPYCDPFNAAIIRQVEDDLKFLWGLPSRNYQVYTSAYGELTYNNIGGEMTATILEVAFHDNEADTDLLKTYGFRRDAARAVLQGIVDYFADTHKNAPKIYLPDSPVKLRALVTGPGKATVSWEAPTYGGYGGGRPEGYRVYKSGDGLAWDSGTDVGNVLSYDCLGLTPGEECYFCVAAYNSGGISFPGETMGVRMTPDGHRPAVLLVNGFSRCDRALVPMQYDPFNGWSRRMDPRLINSFNYVPVHGKAIALAGQYFDSTNNALLESGQLRLGDYRAVDWILGRESEADETFDETEQALLSAYLTNGGRVFVSGENIGWDLELSPTATLQDKDFLHRSLQVKGVERDGSNTNVAWGCDGSIFQGIEADFGKDFDNGHYDTLYPNSLAGIGTGALGAMVYRDTGKIAAVQYADACKRIIVMGFPFEMIHEEKSGPIMAAIMHFLTAGKE